jgi:hypothetical protein
VCSVTGPNRKSERVKGEIIKKRKRKKKRKKNKERLGKKSDLFNSRSDRSVHCASRSSSFHFQRSVLSMQQEAGLSIPGCTETPPAAASSSQASTTGIILDVLRGVCCGPHFAAK